MNAEMAVPVFSGLLLTVWMVAWPRVSRSRIWPVSFAMASVLAGPLHAVCGLAFTLLSEPSPTLPFPFDVVSSLLVAVTVLVMSVIISLPINLVGSAAMIWLGKRFTPARHPAAWALSGGTAMAISIVFIDASTPVPVSMALIITGTCCALTCRRHVSFEPSSQ